MNLLALVWANLCRKPVRTALTLLSLVSAFLLFVLLRAIADAFAGGVSLEGADRAIVDSKYSLTDNLPIAYVEQIRMLDEVAEVAHLTWFGGYYQEPRNTFAQYPVDPARYFAVNHEKVISPAVLEDFVRNRAGAVVSSSLAARYGWQAGDVVPLQSDLFVKAVKEDESAKAYSR